MHNVHIMLVHTSVADMREMCKAGDNSILSHPEYNDGVGAMHTMCK